MSPGFDAEAFFPARLGAAAAKAKRDYRQLLNLSSNELFHPAAAERLRRLVASWPVSLKYPYWPEASRRVGEACGLSGDECLLAAGSDAAIKWLLDSLAGEERTVLLPWPTYEGYEQYAALAGLRIARLPHRGLDGGRLVAALGREAQRHPSGVVAIANPNGFSGAGLPLPELAALADACARAGCLLVIDEAYAAFAPLDASPLCRTHDNVLVVRSFSKSLGLAGLRIAAMLGSPRLLRRLAPTHPFHPVSDIAQHCLLGCLADRGTTEAILADVRAWRAALQADLAGLDPGWRVEAGAANFVLVDLGSAGDRVRLVQGLAERGIAVKDLGGTDGFETCVRITVPGDGERRRLLAALEEIVPEAQRR